MLVIIFFAVMQWQRTEQQAKVVLAYQLSAKAQSLFFNGDSQQMIAMLLAIQSMRLSPVDEAAHILQTNMLTDSITHPEELISDACSRVTRNLTRAEWNQYIGDALPYQAVCPNLPIEIEADSMPTP